jgi:hypothetical protein
VSGPPRHVMLVPGLDTVQAPKSIAPYLDCCDGALALKSEVRLGGPDGGEERTTWALFRAGRQIGVVTVPGPVGPLVPRPRQLIGLVPPDQPTGAQLVAMINEQARARRRGAWLLVAYLVALAVLCRWLFS